MGCGPSAEDPASTPPRAEEPDMEKISESGEEGTDIVVDVNDDKTSTVSTEKTPILKSQPRKSRSASVTGSIWFPSKTS